jgi:hypothetical protein
MAFNPKSLANLKPFDSDVARKLQKKSVVSAAANRALKEEFKMTAKNFISVMEDLPNMSSLDVIKMSMLHAIQKENYEDAARYAGMLAEYEKPKLQRIDQNVTSRTADLSDDELKAIIEAEGLK